MNSIMVNGVNLAYERRGQGRPLVLIHGYPLDHTIWDPVVPLLEADFDLILPDLRGFGESAAPATGYQMTDLAADLAALLDQLGIARAVIAGHSMGGYVALAFARAYPERVLGLGLVASQAVADPPDRKAVRYQTADQVEKNGVGDVAASMPEKLTADPGLQAKLKGLIARQSPVAVAAALRAMAGRPDATDALPGLDFPVACIHGLADGLIPIERAYEVKNAVSHGHVMGVESAGHMPMMESPQATARGLVKFLGSDPEQEKKIMKAGGMGIGIAIGLLIGIGFGIVTDNLAIGLAVGLPIGVVIGAWLRRRIDG